MADVEDPCGDDDILVNTAKAARFRESNEKKPFSHSVGESDLSFRWPKTGDTVTIPVKIDRNFRDYTYNKIKRAFAKFESKTCIR